MSATDSTDTCKLITLGCCRMLFGHQAQYQPGFESLADQEGPSREATPPVRPAARSNPIAAAAEIPGLAPEASAARGPSCSAAAPGPDPLRGAPADPRIQSANAVHTYPRSRGPTPEAEAFPAPPGGPVQDPRTQHSASVPLDVPLDPRVPPGRPAGADPPTASAAHAEYRSGRSTPTTSPARSTHCTAATSAVQKRRQQSSGWDAPSDPRALAMRVQPGTAPVDPRLQAAVYKGAQRVTESAVPGPSPIMAIPVGGPAAAPPTQHYAAAQPAVQYKPRDFSKR